MIGDGHHPEHAQVPSNVFTARCSVEHVTVLSPRVVVDVRGGDTMTIRMTSAPVAG